MNVEEIAALAVLGVTVSVIYYLIVAAMSRAASRRVDRLIAFDKDQAAKEKEWASQDAEISADYDPLDPHGDGTLRPGDPIFDAMMRGNSVIGNRNEDGTWVIKEIEDDK